jgi:hypothetical protein
MLVDATDWKRIIPRSTQPALNSFVDAFAN